MVLDHLYLHQLMEAVPVLEVLGLEAQAVDPEVPEVPEVLALEAPAIAAGLEFIKQTANQDDIVIIMPSDHLIVNTDAFVDTVKKAQELAGNAAFVSSTDAGTYRIFYFKKSMPVTEQSNYTTDTFAISIDKATGAASLY